MYHDPVQLDGQGDRSSDAFTSLDEIELIARAERLRGKYFGEWLRRWFGRRERAAAASAPPNVAPASRLPPTTLRPQRS
jgi:hypothetical protein